MVRVAERGIEVSAGVAVAAATAPRPRRRLAPAAAGFAGLLVVLVLVEVAVRAGLIVPTVVARPTDAVAAIFTLQRKVDFVGATLATFAMTTAALLLAIVVALPVGWLLYRRAALGLAFEGWLAALFAAPVFLLYPLFMVVFGRTFLTLVLMGFIPGVIPMIIQIRAGLLGVSPTLINVGRTLGLAERGIFWKIMVPAAAPAIFTGFRLGLMYTLINIVAIEYLLDFGGLGRIVSDRHFRFDIPGTYASIIAIAAISITLNWAIGRCERKVAPS